MSSTQVEVKVVYSDSGSRPVKMVTGRGARSGSHRGLALVGLLSFVVASGMIYVIWWPADHFIYMTLTTKTPVPGIDTDQLGMLFGIPPSMDDSQDLHAMVSSAAQSDAPQFVGMTATKVIGASAYGWLTLSTVAAFLLALSAGAAWSCAYNGPWRSLGVVLLFLGLAGLTIVAYFEWKEYGRRFPPSHLRMMMASLVVLALTLGLAIGKGVQRCFRIGAISVILAGAGTAIALYLGGQCDAVSPEKSSLLFLLLAFAVHSSYGWILMFLGPKVAPA